MTVDPAAPPRRIEYVALSKVRTADRNPRSHLTLEKVKGSIRKYGFVEAAVHDGRTGKIIAGHGRQLALEQMLAEGESVPEGVMVDPGGEWLMPITYGWASQNDAEAETLLVNLNRLAEVGGWDTGGLAALLDELRGSSPDDFVLSGFESVEVDQMLADLAAQAYEELEDPADLDDVGPAPAREATICQLGDVWVLGRHRLAVGDARELATVKAALGGARAQMVFTDPPYGVSYAGQNGMVIVNDDLDLEKLGKLLETVFGVIKQVLVDGGSFYICTSDIAEGEFRNALVRAGLQMRQQVVWVKDRFVLGRKDYHYQHEAILYGAAPGGEPVTQTFEADHETVLYGWKDGSGHLFEGGRKQSTTWLFPKPKSSDLHPTMKPVALVRRAIMNSSEPGDGRGRVLDPFAGSGSTLIACELAQRSASLVELDPPYADVICRRFERHTKVAPVRERDGEIVSFL